MGWGGVGHYLHVPVHAQAQQPNHIYIKIDRQIDRYICVCVPVCMYIYTCK